MLRTRSQFSVQMLLAPCSPLPSLSSSASPPRSRATCFGIGSGNAFACHVLEAGQPSPPLAPFNHLACDPLPRPPCSLVLPSPSSPPALRSAALPFLPPGCLRVAAPASILPPRRPGIPRHASPCRQLARCGMSHVSALLSLSLPTSIWLEHLQASCTSTVATANITQMPRWKGVAQLVARCWRCCLEVSCRCSSRVWGFRTRELRAGKSLNHSEASDKEKRD